MESGGNMKSVFTRFCEGLRKVEKSIESKGHSFMWNEHLGYVLTCPSNLGTGLRGGVHLKIPLLSKHDKFEALLKELHLQKRGTGGVDTESTDGTFDISNIDRLGTSEVEQVQRVIDGVELFIKMEKALRAGESIDHLLPATLRPDPVDRPSTPEPAKSQSEEVETFEHSPDNDPDFGEPLTAPSEE